MAAGLKSIANTFGAIICLGPRLKSGMRTSTARKMDKELQFYSSTAGKQDANQQRVMFIFLIDLSMPFC